MIFSPNTSPLAGREGTQLTGTKIGDRLAAEAETNVSLRVLAVEGSGGESFEVQARGELQLGLLIGGCMHGLISGGTLSASNPVCTVAVLSVPLCSAPILRFVCCGRR